MVVPSVDSSKTVDGSSSGRFWRMCEQMSLRERMHGEREALKREAGAWQKKVQRSG